MASSKIIELNENDFSSVLGNTKGLALVDFWAPWCGPCKAIAPILEEVLSDMQGKVSIYKVNVDNNATLASQFSVRAIPTLLIFKDGQVVDQIVGITHKADLINKLEATA